MTVVTNAGPTMLYQDNGDGTMHILGYCIYFNNARTTVNLPNGYVLNGTQSINTATINYNPSEGAFGYDGTNKLYFNGETYSETVVAVNTNINVRKTN